ncbi:MAG: alpha/beta hydrolase [Candidatus Acidiferrales bacterium]
MPIAVAAAAPDSPAPPRRGPRWKRWLKRIALGGLALITLLALAGFSYNSIEQHADARRFPQQGKSVALGPAFPGVSLNIDCSGQGSPTVILDSGLGVPAVGWKFVQPEVAKFTRVCSYDRAGYGWSTPGPMPRTSAEIVKELHALLATAGEKPPYILVGHSFGGYNIRVFNGAYPSEVAGMVLVDASHEDQTSRMPQAMTDYSKKQQESAKWQTFFAPALIDFGVARLMSDTSGPAYLSQNDREEFRYLQLQTKFLAATTSELAFFPNTSADEVRASGNLGDKPLVVLTAGKGIVAANLPPGFPVKAYDDFLSIWRNDLQVREAHLSTRGRQIIVPDSDHMSPFERPDTIISAIHDVFTAASSSSATSPSTAAKPSP